ncbi:YwaF family protein [Nesterenkonia populi]|uniref:YwaF family protein n=1 Tax=Nesterenkonia populi TaxID=1591087 RepID=UPI001479127A|nr:TIGR02206 family membrane protein [Nesterenkonia populi]
MLFGSVHLILLGLTALSAALTVWGAPRLSRPEAVFRVSGWVLLASSVFYTVWLLLPPNFSLGDSLPLHFSDALRFTCAVALIMGARWAAAIAYYWGLTLNSQALLTPHPSMLEGLSVNMVFYWALHIAVLLVPLALLRTDYRPRWRDFGVAYGGAAAWTALTMPINHVLGTNYGFLNRPPDGGSLIDLLGPWPLYVMWLAVLVAAVWAVMTWPWTRRAARQDYDEQDVSASLDALRRGRKRL